MNTELCIESQQNR